METGGHLRRAEHLLNQDRFSEAQTEVKSYLASNPEDAQGLIILVQTHLGLGQNEKADAVVDNILKLDATDPIVLYLKGVTLAQLGKRSNALKFFNSALSFNPTFVEAHASLAMIHFQEGRFEEALAAANAGLEIDAENVNCLNQRSRALLKLGRKEEGIEADWQALKSDPMNPHTHATIGFGELEKGNIGNAKKHFREALRLDPNNEYAKVGMMHAIKSTNIYYRLFLKYIFWMQGLKPSVRWAVVIIGYLLIQTLNRYASDLGALSPVADVIIYAYLFFAISTWIIGPISNIFLRFHAFGKYLLSEEDIKTANLSAILLGISLVGLSIFLSSGDEEVLWSNFGFYLLCFGIALTVVVSAIENAVLEKSKRNLRKVGSIFGIAFVLVIFCSLIIPGLAYSAFNWLIYGFVAFQFYANSQE